MRLTTTVNGAPVTREIVDSILLAEFLREDLGLTGTHVGCDTTQCGCCTVRLDDMSVKSCTVLAAQVEGRSVTTIEGLAQPNGTLHPLQEAFRTCHGLQCGFCTPGQIMAGVDLIERWSGELTEHQVREEMEGNLCRCTGYHNIVRAILSAHGTMRGAGVAGQSA